ncbi:MAG: hypothetical protein FWF02_00835 [Micrococcales bacterium]|nr:hypothetical protein [Micrococcales bacterium]MCL2666242.1 hypothetical protein [Micrococcales bacterium]
MSSLDDVLESVVRDVDGAIGCAVADMRSGALLGVAQHVEYFTQEYLEAVAAAAVQMFRGPTVRHVEDLICHSRGRPTERLVEEMQMTTRHTIHFMMVLPNIPEAVVVLITRRDTSLGMGWAATRRSVLDIEPILLGPAD